MKIVKHLILINYYSILRIDKTDLRRKDKFIALSNISIYYTWKNIKKSCKNNRFKISTLIWNNEFELPDGSFSISDIQNCFEYIIKNIKKRQLILQQKYTQIKQKIESRLRLKQDIILRF